jgi:hypothetical protein
MNIQKSSGLFRLDNPNKLISILPIRDNIVWLCEQDKTIETFYFTKRVEVNICDLWEYIIALRNTTYKNKKNLIVKVIDILNKFENKKEVQIYLVE